MEIYTQTFIVYEGFVELKTKFLIDCFTNYTGCKKVYITIVVIKIMRLRSQLAQKLTTTNIAKFQGYLSHK